MTGPRQPERAGLRVTMSGRIIFWPPSTQVPRQAFLLLVLGVTMLPVAARAESEIPSCETSVDCKDDKFPHCYVYWKDETFKDNKNKDGTTEPGKAKVQGVCVECLTECDCGVNQYCGVGTFKIPKLESKNEGATPLEKKKMKLFGEAFENMAIRSVCHDYAIYGDDEDSMPKERCSAHIEDTLITEVVEEKTEEGKKEKKYRSSEGYLSKILEPRFCGKVHSDSWAPAFYTCVQSEGSADIDECAQGDNDSDLSTKNDYQTAAVCPKWAFYNDTAIGKVEAAKTCQGGLNPKFAGGGYNFESPSIEWKGACVRGKCAICWDNSKRCVSEGIPQICLDGQWRPLRGNDYEHTDVGSEQLPNNLAALSQLTTAVFAGLCFVVLLLYVSSVCFSNLKGSSKTHVLLQGQSRANEAPPAPCTDVTIQPA